MYYNLSVIILKRQDFKEDDLLVTVYSLEKGKLTLLARGAKKIKSKLAGHLEPVSLSYLNIVDGRSIDQLIGAAMLQSYGKIKTDIDKLSAAGWFLNLLDQQTMENHPDARVFLLTRKYLDFLEQKSQDYAIAKLAGGFKLLHLLGLNPAGKAEVEFKDEINFMVKSSIGKIYENENIHAKQNKLAEILSQETHM